MSTEDRNTIPGPVPTVDTLREQFAAGLLTATAAAEQLGATESFRAAHQAMREAFDRVAGLAARPRVEETTPADRLGPKLPGWDILNDANPLILEHLIDTACFVATHLEGIAFALGSVRDDEGGPSREAAHGLAESIRIGIAALRAHTRAGQAA